MDAKTSKRIQNIISLILMCMTVMFFSGCPEKKAYRIFKSKVPKFKFTCEIPTDWTIMERDLLFISSPEFVENVPSGIHIRRTYTPFKNEIEEEERRAKYLAKIDPTFKQEPLKPIQVGKFKAVTYSWTQKFSGALYGYAHPAPGRSLEELREDSKDSRPPKPVMRKETYVYFDEPEMNYFIFYVAPVAIYDRKTKQTTPVDMYDKYLPVFTHLLETFKKIEK